MVRAVTELELFLQFGKPGTPAAFASDSRQYGIQTYFSDDAAPISVANSLGSAVET
ncbi:hypothetical protein [Haladaptatus paucihalophilus]|uniref:hypothetical protein n=1 Tax=Haladaptatus paucihalophilus TaxID=367189 RepID=UPI0015C56936|nr:hypothetical protein [Haladaptatus paucihalophilus]